MGIFRNLRNRLGDNHDKQRFHVGGVYRGVRCNERSVEGRDASSEPARPAPRRAAKKFSRKHSRPLYFHCLIETPLPQM